MKRLALIFLALCGAVSAAITGPTNCAYVYDATAGTGAQTSVFGTAASNCVTGASNVAGDLIEVKVSYMSHTGTPVVSGCTDLQSNTYTSISNVGPYDGVIIWMLYAQNIAGGSANQVTCLLSGGTGSQLLIQADEYAGVATTGALDTFANGSGASSVSSFSVGITTAAAGDLLVFSGGSNVNAGTFVAGTGFSLGYQPEIYYGNEYQVTSTAGTYTASISFTGPIHFIGLVVAFKPAASAFTSFQVIHSTAGVVTGTTAWSPDGWGDGGSVPATGGLSGAIANASACDQIILHHATIYQQPNTSSTLTLNNFSGNCTVIVTGDDPAAVPPPGTRVVTGNSPSPPSYLPLIQMVACTTYSGACYYGGASLITPACNSHDFTFQGLAFGIANGGTTGTSSSLVIGDAIGGAALLVGLQLPQCTPHRLNFQSIWAAGNYNQPGPCHAFIMDFDDSYIADSYIDEFGEYGQDCQALFQSSGRNWVVRNTQYNSATENFMCGGSGMTQTGKQCSHGQFIGDYGTKHIQWRVFASNIPPVLASPGLAKLSYNSGYTFSGGPGNCTFGTFNNGVTAVTATLAISASNTAGAVTITAAGSGGTYGIPPTTAVLTSGTSTCTGSSASITSVLQGDNRNVIAGVPSGCVYYPPDSGYDGVGGGEIWVNGNNSCTENGAFPPVGSGLTPASYTTGPWYECGSGGTWTGPFSSKQFSCKYNTAFATGGQSGGEKDTWELKNGQDFRITGTVWSGMWASLQSELFTLNGPVTNPGGGQSYSRGTHGVLLENSILRDSVGGLASGNGFQSGIAADPFYGVIERNLLLDQVSMGTRGCAGCTYQTIPGQSGAASTMGETPTITCFIDPCNPGTASQYSILMAPGGWVQRHITSVNSAPSTAYIFDTSGQSTTLAPPGAAILGIYLIDNVFQLGSQGVGGAGAGDPGPAQVFNPGGGIYSGCKYWAPGTTFANNIVSEDTAQGGAVFTNTGGSNPYGGTNGPGLNGVGQGTSMCPALTSTSTCCYNNYLPATQPLNSTPGTLATWNASNWTWTYPDYTLSTSSTACNPDTAHPTTGAPAAPQACTGKASDGTNPGADIPTVMGMTAYSIGGQNNPNLGFSLTPPRPLSSSSVAIYYQAPAGDSACTVTVSPTEVLSGTGSHTVTGNSPTFTDTVTGLSTTQHLWWYSVACADAVNGGKTLTQASTFQM